MNNRLNSEKFDVVVIGGGPAGMMAAGRAGELGAKVLLIEKNKELGKKLLLTGKGRCNLTQAEPDEKKFLETFGKTGKFLFPAILNFGVKETMDFFEKRGLKLKTERGGRVFPETDKAQDVLKVLSDYLQESKVFFLPSAEIFELKCGRNKINEITYSKEKIYAHNYIICTGGKSYAWTGSNGAGYKWLKKLGHHIIEPRPALTPIKIKEKWVKDLQGLSLKNIKITIFSAKSGSASGGQNNKKQDERFGEMLFTHFGLSGPIILDVSKKVGELLSLGEVIISLDLKPALEFAKLDERLQRDFKKYQNKAFKNALNDLLPKRLIEIIVKFSGISQDKPVNQINKNERLKLVNLLKDFKMTAIDLMGFDQAIITTGGVDLKEIDPRTMKSKIIDNLFLAGEIINLDGPTGGYNLQLCWSTGYLAGEKAAQSSLKDKS
ncbi:MAG: NAD(P)/FAD-dependent oxidoreductase [Patescibacteria group bacterium]